MTNHQDWLNATSIDLYNLRRELGQTAAKEAEHTGLTERQTLFETRAVELVKENLLSDMVLQAEDREFQAADQSEIRWIIGLDPTDGTAGDARFHGVGQLTHGLPTSLVIYLRQNIANPTFANVQYANILDLTSGQLFIANAEGAFCQIGGSTKPLKRTIQYNKHNPAVGMQIARRALAPIRFLIPYGVCPEVFSDSHSSAVSMLWALLGYSDVYFNCKLPGIEGAGQRGHELGAIAVFARALGACAFQTDTEKDKIAIGSPLDKAPYTFDEQTSIILGVDENVVRHYIDLINHSLQQSIPIGAEMIKVAHLLSALHAAVPDQRWSLPLVT